MKMRFGYMTPLLTLAFILSGAYSAHGQNSLSDPLRGSSGYSAPRGTARGSDTKQDPNYYQITENPDPIAKSFRQSGETLARLKAKLTEALTLKDEKIITDVKGEVKGALNEHFSRDLAIRESKLAVLIKRADNAESRNKQRLAARDELIELQLQSYVLETDAAVTAPGSDERILNSGLTSPTTLGGGDSFDLSIRRSSTSSISNLEGGTGQVPQQDSKTTIEEARMKLARAASVDQETQATKELKEALSVYFLHDLEERDRLLKTVRADIQKMQQKLEQRSNSKNAIVEMQFKMFVNEAIGLGFFSPK